MTDQIILAQETHNNLTSNRFYAVVVNYHINLSYSAKYFTTRLVVCYLSAVGNLI